MAGEASKEFEGTVVEALPNDLYRVELENGVKILAHVGARARMHTVRILPGDQVRVEVSEYNAARGRITHRYA